MYICSLGTGPAGGVWANRGGTHLETDTPLSARTKTGFSRKKAQKAQKWIHPNASSQEVTEETELRLFGLRLLRYLL